MRYVKLLAVLGMVMGMAGGASAAQEQRSPTLHLLVVADPFALALQEATPALESRYGATLDIEIVGYNDTREQTLRNARDLHSRYDIVSFDVLWMGDYAAHAILLPLNAHISATPDLQPDDFLAAAYTASSAEGVQYGLPIQPHPELLWVRRDLFEAAGLAYPTTTDEVLVAAAQLNDPASGVYGICWNGQRRQALGQQMAHFYGAFGQPLLDGNTPTLDTERGLAAAEYALALLAYSPPDILTMAWDQRILRFNAGGCAMTYGWGARTFLAPEVVGEVVYLPAPHAPNADPVTPIGAWSLGIPANIGERESEAWRFLAWLSSPEIQHLLAVYGNGGVPRLSLLHDEALAQRYPYFPVIAALAESGELDDWMRPALPQWPQLEVILGTVFHDMLRGQLTPAQAVIEVQRQAVALFAEDGL